MYEILTIWKLLKILLLWKNTKNIKLQGFLKILFSTHMEIWNIPIMGIESIKDTIFVNSPSSIQWNCPIKLIVGCSYNKFLEWHWSWKIIIFRCWKMCMYGINDCVILYPSSNSAFLTNIAGFAATYSIIAISIFSLLTRGVALLPWKSKVLEIIYDLLYIT